MKVDIILPVYKPQITYLYEAVDSILNQTYVNWHLYIIDDASKDYSIDKLKKKYARHHKKISYHVFEENHRAAFCRNYAVRKGNGEFIAFIDQDDIWLPDKLELQIARFKNDDVIAIHGDLQLVDVEGSIIKTKRWEKENNARKEVPWCDCSKTDLSNRLFLNPNIRIISSMVKRSAFEQINGFKDQFFGGEDETFWFELATIGKIAHIDKVLFKRREHDSNTLNVYANQRLIGYAKSIVYLKTHYNHLDLSSYKHLYTIMLFAIAKFEFKEKKYCESIVGFGKILVINPKLFIQKAINKVFKKSKYLGRK